MLSKHKNEQFWVKGQYKRNQSTKLYVPMIFQITSLRAANTQSYYKQNITYKEDMRQ